MKSYAYGFSSSKYRIALYSPSFWWWRCEMRHCLCDKMKWDEWCRHRDVGLGYCMGYLNEGAAIPQQSIWSLKRQLSDQRVGDLYCMETVNKGMVHTWGKMGRVAWDFITSLPTICNLKLMYLVLFVISILEHVQGIGYGGTTAYVKLQWMRQLRYSQKTMRFVMGVAVSEGIFLI